MIRTLVRALLAMLVLGVLTGLIFPLAVTGVAQLAFRDQADGSLVRMGGRVVGSSLIGQEWQGLEWFYGRPSAADYDAAASAGSNLGPTSGELADLIRGRASAILALESSYTPDLSEADIPVDLLTASASGLDPDITSEAAEFQAPRIAAVRGLPIDEVLSLIDEQTEGRSFGVLGQPRVNVLELNLALQQLVERST